MRKQNEIFLFSEEIRFRKRFILKEIAFFSLFVYLRLFILHLFKIAIVT